MNSPPTPYLEYVDRIMFCGDVGPGQTVVLHPVPLFRTIPLPPGWTKDTPLRVRGAVSLHGPIELVLLDPDDQWLWPEPITCDQFCHGHCPPMLRELFIVPGRRFRLRAHNPTDEGSSVLFALNVQEPGTPP